MEVWKSLENLELIELSFFFFLQKRNLYLTQTEQRTGMDPILQMVYFQG